MTAAVIQLTNFYDEHIGLYLYDAERHDENAAVEIIEKTLEEYEDSEELEESDDDLQEFVDKILSEKHGIVRIYAAEARTDSI